MPAIFSSSRIEPVARSMPALVPIPSSPRKRAPGSVSSAARGSPRRARAARATTSPSRERQLDARDVHARAGRGDVKRIVPLADSSSGPVKTSPLGMLRRPSELIQVRPPTRRRRSVPSASIRISRAGRAARRAAPGASLSSRHACDRVGTVEEQGPVDERRVVVVAHPRLLGERRRRPDRAAPARGAAAPPGPAPRAGGAGDERPDRCRSARGCSRAPGSHAAHRPRRLDQLERGERVELLVPRMAVEVRRPPRGARRSGGHAPRSSSARWKARDERLRPAVVVDTRICWPARHLEAPVGDQRGERVGVDHGASSSGKCSAACSRSDSRTNAPLVGGRHPVAAEQLLLAIDLAGRRSSRTTARRSNSSSVARCQRVLVVEAAAQASAYSRRAPWRQRAAQLELVARRRRGTPGVGAASLLALALTARLPTLASAPARARRARAGARRRR